jgi:hypothetical protein
LQSPTLPNSTISFRQPLGFDSNIATAYHGRISIHTYIGDGSSDETYLQATLADGDSYSDTSNGWTFAQVNHWDNYATVQIDMGDPPLPPVCITAPPAVSITPPMQSADAGMSLDYVVSVINNDDSNCNKSSFSFMPTIPSGWSSSLSLSRLTLAPGASGSTTFRATSASGANPGTYSIGLDVNDSNESLHAASLSGYYVVNQPPTSIDSGLEDTATAWGVYAEQMMLQLSAQTMSSISFQSEPTRKRGPSRQVNFPVLTASRSARAAIISPWSVMLSVLMQP